MTLTFPYPVKADLTDEMSLPSIILSYGDGYKQRTPDGLNLPKTVWNIQCPLANKAQETALQAFLISVGNSVPFLWQSPRDTKPEFYYITGKVGGTYRRGGGLKPDFFVRTMQFEYANIIAVTAITPTPTPTPTPAIVSIGGGTEITGFTISNSTIQSVDTIVSLNRAYFSFYTNFLTDNITVTILANSLSVNLPFGARNTTGSFGKIRVIILNSPNYILDIARSYAEINFP